MSDEAVSGKMRKNGTFNPAVFNQLHWQVEKEVGQEVLDGLEEPLLVICRVQGIVS